ncbi:cation diffusion facilitator family transporter [Serpentinicella alkaliphila]|uniref:Cation diffusion facilitator family transporter n=1 Tax=Serpentinicella alkaliphila TaxID=1734049 RepID=A0A4R2UK48_9FIRM|nr:cation diffusion facilitator family transporter [Serpentinicella alkaliphila]QUH26946.1 cation transporter [Serpentinicella alkaliphila]TCQ08183.1 cation diffusion facilitator family transporter [Serpentinicella alkaliphila]
MNDKLRYEYSRKASILSIIGNILLTGFKVIIGLLSGSIALVADAFHSASDLIGTIILLQGLKIAHMPPDESHPYGHHRAETITSKILAIILIITALGIGYSSFRIIRSPNVTPPETFAIYIIILSIIVKEGMYRYAYKIGKLIQSDAVIADAWHHRSDAFSSIGALIGVGGAILGYPIMDPLAGIFVSILILKTGIEIYISAVRDLMDTAPSDEIINELKDAAYEANGVEGVQDIKVRKHGSKLFVDMKICVNSNITVSEGHGAAARAKENIIKSNEYIQDVLIHVNPCYKEHSKDCDTCTEEKKNGH